MLEGKAFYSSDMTRYHLIALCVVLLPTLVSGVGIDLIMSANEEVRDLLRTQAVANGFQQCIVDQSVLSFSIPKLDHLHTVTDVIRSFISKSTVYPITERDALLFQTELASSIVDVVVNEPSNQEEYAHTLSTIIRILRDCQARNTGKSKSDLATIVETFTKLFVDVIVNVGKINAEEQKLLQTFEQVEKYGFLASGEDTITKPLDHALQFGPQVIKKNLQSAFQSDDKQPTLLSTNAEKSISVETKSNVPKSQFSSGRNVVVQENTNNENLHLKATASFNSSLLETPTSSVLPASEIDTSVKIPAQLINIGNSNTALSSTFDQKDNTASGSPVEGLNTPSETISFSNSATTNNSKIRSSLTGESVRLISANDFKDPGQRGLARVRRFISDSAKNVSTGQEVILTDHNLIQIPTVNNSDQNETIRITPPTTTTKPTSKTLPSGRNKIFNDSPTKTKTNSDMSKLFSSALKELVKSGKDQFIADIMHDVIAKQNLFEPMFVSQIKEEASKILLNTMTSLSMATSVPTTIGQFLKKIMSRDYFNQFTGALNDAVERTHHMDDSENRLKFFVKSLIEGIVKFLYPYVNMNELPEENTRSKREDIEISYQDIGFPTVNVSDSFPSSLSEVPSSLQNIIENRQVSPIDISSSSFSAVQSTQHTFAENSSITPVSELSSSTIYTVPSVPQNVIENSLTSYNSASSTFPVVPETPQIVVENNLVPPVSPLTFSEISAVPSAPEIIAENGLIPSAIPQISSTSTVPFPPQIVPENIPITPVVNAPNPIVEEIDPTNSLSPIASFTPYLGYGNSFSPPAIPGFTTAFSEAVASSVASASTGNKTIVIENAVNTQSFSVTNNSSSSTNSTAVPKIDVARKKTPTIVSAFSSAFSKAVSSSETIADAVELTLRGPTTNNTLFKIMFDTLLQEGISDPTAEGRSESYLIASNFDGMTPLVFTNALSGAVGNTLLDEGLISYYSISDMCFSYINALEDTLDQFKVGNDPELNSKALVIGTERFISSHGISLLHGASEMASHFRDELISARDNVIKTRDSVFPFPDIDNQELNEVGIYKSKCETDVSSPTSFSNYFLNELAASNSLGQLFFLPDMTEETAAAFYNSFYKASLSLGIEIPKPDGDVFFSIVSNGLNAKSPSFFARIYANSLEKFLCERDILNQFNSLVLARLFAQVLQNTSGTVGNQPESYFDLLINATFHFLISILILRPQNSVSWTSNFLSELVSTSPEYLPRLIHEIAPEILSPAGLSAPDATKRIYDLAVSVADDVLSENSPNVDVGLFLIRLKATLSQIRKSNPALKPIGLVLGTLLEGISALVAAINAAKITVINFDNSNSSTVVRKFYTAIQTWK